MIKGTSKNSYLGSWEGVKKRKAAVCWIEYETKVFKTIVFLVVFISTIQIAYYAHSSPKTNSNAPFHIKGEKHLRNIKMLTNGGENAEAYFSFNEQKLIFQASVGNLKCDKIFAMDLDGSNKKMVSTGKGRATCAYFLPDDKRIIFSSNLHSKSRRNFDLYIINIDGSGLEQIAFNKAFDGFPMFTRDGKFLVFASNRFNRKKRETNIFVAKWVN